MLLRHRGDLLAANERNALFEVQKENQMDDVAFLYPPLRVMLGYFGFSKLKNDQAFQQRFNQALNRLHERDVISDLQRKQGLKIYPKMNSPR
ncbi:MAG: hypothetical protein V7739_09615 [Motiliproteus sp.]